MSTTKLVYWGGSKGGVGKSTNAHLSCLGAILYDQPAAYVLTDPDREIRDKGRPYELLDGREPKQLADILNASRKTSAGGWLMIDGGGNRPAFDSAIAEEVDLCIFPFRPSQEDMDAVSRDMDRISNALAWPTAWPTNIFAIPTAQGFINRLSKKYPLRTCLPSPWIRPRLRYGDLRKKYSA
jgi:chromosome partitioning protein